MQEKFLTVNEYARVHRIHPTTVRRLCRRGRLEGKRVGRQWRIVASGERL